MRFTGSAKIIRDNCRESGSGSRRLVQEAAADPDENHFEREDRGVGEIFCQHYGSDGHGRTEVIPTPAPSGPKLLYTMFVSISRA